MGFLRSLLLAACLAVWTLSGCSTSLPPNNPCSTNNGGCDSNAFCSDTSGSVTCSCKDGYRGDGKSCEQLTACGNLNISLCDGLAECVIDRETGFPRCRCPDGYSGDGFKCIPRPTCAKDRGGCDVNASCSEDSRSGRVTCECNFGYEGDGYTCVKKPSCEDLACVAPAKCEMVGGQPKCLCDEPDYVPHPTDNLRCVAKDNCVNNTCGAFTTCMATEQQKPEYTMPPICACNAGYTYVTGSTTECRAFLACEPGVCGANSTCTNQPDTGSPLVGDRICACESGYSRSQDGLSCVDDNECTLPSSDPRRAHCDPNAMCTNTPGSYSCSCKSGFEHNDDDTLCLNIDECDIGADNCDYNATCTDRTPTTGNPAGFTCACNPGYTGAGTTGTCADKNECATNNGGCGPIVANKCTNTDGSFECSCQNGYAKNEFDVCADVNECDTNNGGCGAVESNLCTNTAGSFSCSCQPGHVRNAQTNICEDINECQDGNNGGCDVNAVCANTVGSRTCTCKAGYFGTGVASTNPNAPGCEARYAQVAVGDRHICALRADGANSTGGTLVCWGANWNGQFGNGTSTSVGSAANFNPTNVSMVPIVTKEGAGSTATWTRITAGNDVSCGVRSNGDLWCWGLNASGQLGNNSTSNALLPVNITSPTVTAWVDISTDFSQTCATTTGSRAMCWGANGYFQLGTGTGLPALVPSFVDATEPPIGPRFSAIGTGFQHSCAYETTGKIWCWGSNGSGQLGRPSSTGQLQSPTLIQAALPDSGSPQGTSLWRRLAVGFETNCAVQADGSAWCWGRANDGQVGDNDFTNRFEPRPVQNSMGHYDSWWLATSGGLDIPPLAVGEKHVCGIRQDQSIACWGDNTFNQLGRGSSGLQYPSASDINLPSTTPSSMKFRRISARKSITCAISEDPELTENGRSDYDRRLWCWGGTVNANTLGYGSTPTIIRK